MPATHDTPYYFDEQAADRPIKFLEKFCRHIEGELQGQLVQMTPFWRETVRDIYGWKKKSDGRRRYRYIYIEIPKKNAKSFIMSGLGLYMTCADGEPGAKVFALAGDKDQARIIFNAAKQMVEADKTLSKSLFVLKDSISHKKTGSVFRVLSADVKTKHGPNTSAAFFDELHVQPNGLLFETIEKGVASRREPLVFMITTAGFKNTWAHQKHIEYKGIAEGRTPSKYTYVRMFNLTEERAAKEWDNPEVWKEVNPNFGITTNEEYFYAQLENVQRNPAELSGFLRLHLNVWTGTEKSWEITPHWSKCDFGPPDEAALVGRECFIGVDLADRGDTTAVVLLWPPRDATERYEMKLLIYIPQDTLFERKKGENDQWDVWERTGLIQVTPGNVTDQAPVIADIKTACRKYRVMKIAVDPWRGTGFMVDLQGDGLPAEEYLQVPKKISPPLIALEKLIMKGEINHGGNPVLAWQVGNVVIEEDINQNRRPSKAKSKARIDGIAALINALGISMGAEAPPKSIYDDYEQWSDE